jgi:TRAP-type C4-dicarboxylate transport system permease small subunit
MKGPMAPITVLPTAACAALAILMMLHVCADVALRYLFNAPLPGTLEIVAGYYMVAVTFLPLAGASAGEGHIVVDLFTRRWKPGARRALDIVNSLLTVIYLSIFVYASTYEAWIQTERGEVWLAGAGSLPIWPSRWFLPVGAALMAIYLLYFVGQQSGVLRRNEIVTTVRSP